MNQQRKVLGVFPSQLLLKMIDNQEIIASKENIQPASIDLSISQEIYRMRGTFLPQTSEKIADIVKKECLYKTNLDYPLEKNGVYLVKLNEKLNLSAENFAISSSKSSTGRVDLQTRLLVDGYPRFDRTPVGYQGDLWLQIIPKSFLIKLNTGDKLNQIRLFNSPSILSYEEIEKIYVEHKLFFNENNIFIDSTKQIINQEGHKLVMSIDLCGSHSHNIIGYKSLNIDQVLDFSKINHYKAEDFFEPIYAPNDKKLLLDKESFYIFYTKELIRIPRNFSAEMMAYDISSGEFRSHYAGFFDPGFGYGEKGEINGRRAVLEVRSFDHNFIVRDHQPICQMVFEQLIEPSEYVYGTKHGSHYSDQDGPKLSKHFK